MSTFAKFLEDQDNDPKYFLIEVPEELTKHLNVALESYWQDYDNKWRYRLDPADPKIPLQKHIHVAQKKHTSNKKMQVSWNIDGTRHDKKSFNANIGKNKKAREIATAILGLGSSISLEHYTESQTDSRLLLECVFDENDIRILIVE